jgi:hypothetical protein
MTIKEIITEAVERHGFEWTAWVSGVTAGTVRNWFNRGTVPRFDEMVKLCRALNVNLKTVEVE